LSFSSSEREEESSEEEEDEEAWECFDDLSSSDSDPLPPLPLPLLIETLLLDRCRDEDDEQLPEDDKDEISSSSACM
jgi:hypothetical protein